jgi:prevent-host-death family protein
MVTRRISAKQARDNFSDLLGSVHYGGQPVIVEKKGRPFAVVISPEDFENLQALAKARLLETVRAVRQDNEGVDPDEVFADVTEAVEAVRQEEYERETTRRS